MSEAEHQEIWQNLKCRVWKPYSWNYQPQLVFFQATIVKTSILGKFLETLRGSCLIDWKVLLLTKNSYLPHSICKPHNGNLPHYPYCYGPHYPHGGSTYRRAITIQTSNSINDKSESKYHMHVIRSRGWYIFYLIFENHLSTFKEYSNLFLNAK